LLAAGFSVGASMLWYLACAPPSSLSGRFTAFAAFSGTFWIPQPQNCAGPPFSLIQLHGTADTVFPLHGRTVQNGRMRQGDSMEAMAMLRRHDSCQPAAHRAGSMPMLDAAAMPCEVDDSCEGGTKIRMCIHPGKHEVEGFWIEAAWSFVREIVSGPPSEPGEGLRLQNRGG
jgi:polyhydroxybutyrate depolymerase